MSRLTGKLLEIAQQRVLSDLSNAHDKRYEFWTEEDSLHQQEQKLTNATVIHDVASLSRLREMLSLPSCQIVGIDVETTNLNHWEEEILGVGFSVCHTDTQTILDCTYGKNYDALNEHFDHFYVQCNNYPGERKELIAALGDLIDEFNGHVTWYMHNAKFDMTWLKSRLGFHLHNIHDSFVMAYILGEPQKGIDKLSAIYLSRFPHTLKTHLGKDKPTRQDMLGIDPAWLADYCCEDTFEGILLGVLFEQRLRKSPITQQQLGFYTLWNVYELIDLYCIHSILWAEEEGVLIDWDKLDTVGESVQAEMFGIECEIAEILDMPMKEASKLATSAKLLSDYLYNKLQLPTTGIKETKFGYSTDETSLKKNKNHHPLPSAILDHRKLAKLNGTYIKGFYERRRGEKLYTSFNNCQTDTGRLSSSDPNLHNIPNPVLSPTGKLLRQCFIASEGSVLVKADYSQFELRILAHFSQDPYLLNAYREGLDVHSVVACLLFDIPYDQFDPSNNPVHALYRRLTKTINFGLIYGMTAHRLYNESRKAGLDYTFAYCEEIMLRYWSRLTGVTEWMAYVKLKAVRDGYTETIFGRRRYFDFRNPYLKHLRENPNEVNLSGKFWRHLEHKGVLNDSSDQEAFRACGNAPIQGSNADAIRIVMGRLYDRYYHSPVKLLLNVHDEIVLECPWEIQEEVKSTLVNIMTSVIKLDVPVVVDPKVALTWGDT